MVTKSRFFLVLFTFFSLNTHAFAITPREYAELIVEYQPSLVKGVCGIFREENNRGKSAFTKKIRDGLINELVKNGDSYQKATLKIEAITIATSMMCPNVW